MGSLLHVWEASLTMWRTTGGDLTKPGIPASVVGSYKQVAPRPNNPLRDRVPAPARKVFLSIRSLTVKRVCTPPRRNNRTASCRKGSEAPCDTPPAPAKEAASTQMNSVRITVPCASLALPRIMRVHSCRVCSSAWGFLVACSVHQSLHA